MADNKESPSEPKKIDPAESAYVIEFIREPLDEDRLKKALSGHFDALAKKHGAGEYTVLYLLDAEDDITSWHSNRIYNAASAAKRTNDILLVVHSPGGSIEPAYLISKTCKRLAKEKFVVAVPRKAKSAATLLALGADEIHMGLMSELGPIDPQIGGFPALGVRNALEILAQLSCQYPNASKMLADYIQAKLDLRILGYFERINESAMQYAERLLAAKSLPEKWTPQTLANHFVNYYKDQGFVIDHDEARELLGDAVVKQESMEYSFANAVYESFDFLRFVLGMVAKKDLDIVGGSQGAFRVFNRKSES